MDIYTDYLRKKSTMNNNVEVVTTKLYTTLWLLLRVEHSSLQVEQDEMVCGIIYRQISLFIQLLDGARPPLQASYKKFKRLLIPQV